MKVTGKNLVVLANKVKSREKLIVDIVSLISDILNRHGRVVKKSSHSAHTHIIIELTNVKNLSFRGDFGQTMFGGNTIRVWHNGKIVMHVTYQCDPKESAVNTFDDKNASWIEILAQIKKKEKQIFTQIAKTKEKKQEEEAKTRLRQKQEKELMEKARRLGLIT